MELIATICPKCGSKGLGPINGSQKCFCGGERITFNVTADEYVKMSDYQINKMVEQMGINPVISKDDAYTIYLATKSTEVIDAMIELKQKDIIEYSLKLGQFKTQLQQQKKQQESNRPHCPTCGSTNIQKIGTGERIASVAMVGIFSKKINKSYKCLNCKHTW